MGLEALRWTRAIAALCTSVISAPQERTKVECCRFYTVPFGLSAQFDGESKLCTCAVSVELVYRLHSSSGCPTCAGTSESADAIFGCLWGSDGCLLKAIELLNWNWEKRVVVVRVELATLVEQLQSGRPLRALTHSLAIPDRVRSLAVCRVLFVARRISSTMKMNLSERQRDELGKEEIGKSIRYADGEGKHAFVALFLEFFLPKAFFTVSFSGIFLLEGSPDFFLGA
uniref:Secreted protein n=1 Tax=Ascaris lumbricoides TaxID=6252 RepID=A0A0M3HUS6_ASCLU